VVGNQVFYQANQEHPEFHELRALLSKTTGVFQMLKVSLGPLSSPINLAVAYGSMAGSPVPIPWPNNTAPHISANYLS
jgi:hypothetical protein